RVGALQDGRRRGGRGLQCATDRAAAQRVRRPLCKECRNAQMHECGAARCEPLAVCILAFLRSCISAFRESGEAQNSERPSIAEGTGRRKFFSAGGGLWMIGAAPLAASGGLKMSGRGVVL